MCHQNPYHLLFVLSTDHDFTNKRRPHSRLTAISAFSRECSPSPMPAPCHRATGQCQRFALAVHARLSNTIGIVSSVRTAQCVGMTSWLKAKSKTKIFEIYLIKIKNLILQLIYHLFTYLLFKFIEYQLKFNKLRFLYSRNDDAQYLENKMSIE